MKNKITYVINRKAEKTEFRPKKISEDLRNETSLSEQEIKNLVNRVTKEIYKSHKTEIFTSEIREIVKNSLLRNKQEKNAEEYDTISISVSEIDNLIEDGCSDNANQAKNPETIHKYIADSISKQYNIKKMPSRLRKAYLDGYLHFHDEEYETSRGNNCIQSDLRFFIKNGVKLDGTGETTSVASPPNHLSTLINHAGQILNASQQNMSGGQGYGYFNIFLAPFCKGLDYNEIKSNIQAFVYNLNMSYSSRGGQVCFSSVNLELGVPAFLKNEPAYAHGGHVNGVYGDYENESMLILKAFIEVLREGSADGKPHMFPNTIFILRDEFMNKEDLLLNIHELISDIGTPYLANADIDEEGGAISVMGALSSDTPVLTRDGAKYPFELKKDDEVMTYAENGTKEWNKITNIISKIPPKKVYKIKCNNGYEFKVTDNHKIPTNQGIIKSENLKVGMELYRYMEKKYMPTEDLESEFIGIFLADGYIRKNKENRNYNSQNIEFHLSKQWKVEKITDICDKIGFNYKFKQKKDKSYTLYIIGVANKFKHLYNKNNEKIFPFTTDKNKLANILKGLMFDGGFQKSTLTFTTSSKRLAENVLFAYSYLGIITSLYIDDRTNKGWKINYQIKIPKNYVERFHSTKIKSIEMVDNNDYVYDLSIENNHNYVCGLGAIHSENCRTMLSNQFTGDWELDTLRCGNLAYCTLNLPLIFEKARKYNNGNWKETIDEYLDIATEHLLYRKALLEKNLFKNKNLNFLTQKDKETGEMYFRYENSSLSYGINGLNEAIPCILSKHNLLDDKGYNLGIEIIEYINNYAKQMKEKHNLRFSVFQTPAESTSYKFGQINQKEGIPTQGTRKVPYNTNSTHIPVNAEISVINRIKKEVKFHKLCSAGSILHLWLGEKPNPKSLLDLTKIIKKEGGRFWAFTNNYTHCRNCNSIMNGLQEQCYNKCNPEKLEHYSRITGYYQKVSLNKSNSGGWNPGKKQELKERKEYNL